MPQSLGFIGLSCGEQSKLGLGKRMDKEDVVQIHNGMLLGHKKNEIMPFTATWMDLEIVVLREIDKKYTE